VLSQLGATERTFRLLATLVEQRQAIQPRRAHAAA